MGLGELWHVSMLMGLGELWHAEEFCSPDAHACASDRGRFRMVCNSSGIMW